MQQRFNQVAPWPTQGKIFTYQPTFVKLSSEEKPWQSPILNPSHDCSPSSIPHHQISKITRSNVQQRTMRVLVLLSMGQYRISKEKSGELLDQWVHVIATTQELRNSTRNLVRMTGDYIGYEGPLNRKMEMWNQHIDFFE